jgi:hypothetical protein
MQMTRVTASPENPEGKTMSTIVCLAEKGVLILGTDSRFMRPDYSGIASDAEQKIHEVAPETFIATSGWKSACEFQETKARELARGLNTTDVRVIAGALGRASIGCIEDCLRSIAALRKTMTPGVREKIGDALVGKRMLHACCLAGRTSDGKLGYVQHEYRVRDGRVTCTSEEYSGDDRRIFVSPADPILDFAQDLTIWSDPPLQVIERLLSALKERVSTIGGPSQIVRIDGGGVDWISPPPVPAIPAGNLLGVQDALFAGTTTFAYSGGGKVTINSSGITLADNNVSPNATVTITSTGITLARGSNSVQVTSSGVGIYGPNGSVVATSSGVTITNGVLNSPVIAITSGGMTINLDATNQFKISGGASSNVVQITEANGFSLSNVGGYNVNLDGNGLRVYAPGNLESLIGPNSIEFFDGSSMRYGQTRSVTISGTTLTFYGGVLVGVS